VPSPSPDKTARLDQASLNLSVTKRLQLLYNSLLDLQPGLFRGLKALSNRPSDKVENYKALLGRNAQCLGTIRSHLKAAQQRSQVQETRDEERKRCQTGQGSRTSRSRRRLILPANLTEAKLKVPSERKYCSTVRLIIM
jgi:hypothetical protein